MSFGQDKNKSSRALGSVIDKAGVGASLNQIRGINVANNVGRGFRNKSRTFKLPFRTQIRVLRAWSP